MENRERNRDGEMVVVLVVVEKGGKDGKRTKKTNQIPSMKRLTLTYKLHAYLVTMLSEPKPEEKETKKKTFLCSIKRTATTTTTMNDHRRRH